MEGTLPNMVTCPCECKNTHNVMCSKTGRRRQADTEIINQVLMWLRQVADQVREVRLRATNARRPPQLATPLPLLSCFLGCLTLTSLPWLLDTDIASRAGCRQERASAPVDAASTGAAAIGGVGVGASSMTDTSTAAAASNSAGSSTGDAINVASSTDEEPEPEPDPMRRVRLEADSHLYPAVVLRAEAEQEAQQK